MYMLQLIAAPLKHVHLLSRRCRFLRFRDQLIAAPLKLDCLGITQDWRFYIFRAGGISNRGVCCQPAADCQSAWRWTVETLPVFPPARPLPGSARCNEPCAQ